MIATALFLFAGVAGIGCAVVLAVYRSGDVERVARECVLSAVSQEREQVNRMLIQNATVLRKNGRRSEAKLVDQLIGLLKSRTAQPEVNVSAFLRKVRRQRTPLEARVLDVAVPKLKAAAAAGKETP